MLKESNTTQEFQALYASLLRGGLTAFELAECLASTQLEVSELCRVMLERILDVPDAPPSVRLWLGLADQLAPSFCGRHDELIAVTSAVVGADAAVIQWAAPSLGDHGWSLDTETKGEVLDFLGDGFRHGISEDDNKRTAADIDLDELEAALATGEVYVQHDRVIVEVVLDVLNLHSDPGLQELVEIAREAVDADIRLGRPLTVLRGDPVKGQDLWARLSAQSVTVPTFLRNPCTYEEHDLAVSLYRTPAGSVAAPRTALVSVPAPHRM